MSYFYLSAKQAHAIDEFVSSEKRPIKVDDFFVNSILALLRNYEPVVIQAADLVAKPEQQPPMDETTFKSKLNDIISGYTTGKDASSLRIVVK